jgi:hypothetical protein
MCRLLTEFGAEHGPSGANVRQCFALWPVMWVMAVLGIPITSLEARRRAASLRNGGVRGAPADANAVLKSMEAQGCKEGGQVA